MGHYKNRKPKPFKGCCGMCTLRTSDGRRNGRLPTLQERRAQDREELELSPEFWEYESGIHDWAIDFEEEDDPEWEWWLAQKSSGG